MKDDKICFSKTLTYLVLLVAVVFGAFWVMNYANSQKLTQNSKASEPRTYQPNAADNANCRVKTGDKTSNCSIFGCGPIKKVATGTSVDGSNVNMSTYDCALNGVLQIAGGKCCVVQNYTAPVVAPTSVPVVSNPSNSTCLSKKNFVKEKPSAEIIRHNNVTQKYYAGFVVYTGNTRKKPINGDSCEVTYKTCMFDRSSVYKGQYCWTPSYMSDLSKSQQEAFKSMCLAAKNKIVSGLGDKTNYVVFDGGTVLNAPVFDQRVSALGSTIGVSAGYCRVKTQQCDNYFDNADQAGELCYMN